MAADRCNLRVRIPQEQKDALSQLSQEDGRDLGRLVSDALRQLGVMPDGTRTRTNA